MKTTPVVVLGGCLVIGLCNSCNSAPPVGQGSPGATLCTVSLQLDHSGQPFKQEGIAVFPVVDGKISLATDKMLGSGTTDDQGAATLDFKCSTPGQKYVIVWMPNGKCCGMLRHNGGALSFDWDLPAGGAKRDLGNMTFEVFEF